MGGNKVHIDRINKIKLEVSRARNHLSILDLRNPGRKETIEELGGLSGRQATYWAGYIEELLEEVPVQGFEDLNKGIFDILHMGRDGIDMNFAKLGHYQKLRSNIIPAVKFYRARMGSGILEAKKYVDSVIESILNGTYEERKKAKKKKVKKPKIRLRHRSSPKGKKKRVQ